MCRIALAILISLFWFGPNAAGQKRRIDSPEVLKQLLAMPAPTPRGGTPLLEAAPPNPRPPDFYSRENEPPDDAPIEDLVDYWDRWAENYSTEEPSEAVKKRLLEACVSDPQLFGRFLNFLPDVDATPAKVKTAYDKAIADRLFDQDWRDKVKKWLVFNSTYFLEELLAIAHKAKDNDKDGDVDREDAISALADVSWTNAVPLLRGLMTTGQPRATALALSLFYEHAIKEKDTGAEERYRRDLQTIASNRTQPGYARNLAVESLSLSEWSGRDEWYLNLFQDESLLEATDSEYTTSPLSTLFDSEPEKWVPIMTRLIESKDINVKTAAAVCLLGVDDNGEIGKNALTPLLPWLTIPTWANDSSNYRMRLVQRLESVKIPESVPGLISIIEAEPTEGDQGYTRGFAAVSLASYQDPRAVPVLKKALAKERDEGQRFRIMKALLTSNGLSEEEQLTALEEYAGKVSTPEGRADVIRYRTPQDEPLSLSLTIGKYLGLNRETPSEALVKAVLGRAEELKTENPAVADALIEIAQQWQGHEVELDILRRIANGSADSATIMEALRRRDTMQQGLRTELEGLASVAGAAQGVGAVLLNDPGLAQGVLNAENVTAKISLLACARLTQTALPVEMVGHLLRNEESVLSLAAESYLLAEDSQEARSLLWERYPNKAFVTGWRENIYYSAPGVPAGFPGLNKREENLREELFKENGPTEILALLSTQENQGSFLRIYSDKAIYIEQEDEARYRERVVPIAQVSAFKDFLTSSGFPEHGPTLEFCHHGCPTNELLMLTKEKGRRVFYQGGWQTMQLLQEHFGKLGEGEGAKIHYKLAQDIKGLEVLYAGELMVQDVAQQAGELRVRVERPETKEEIAERIATYNYEDDEDEEVRVQRLRRRYELQNSRISWRVFANDIPGAVTSQPDSFSTFDPSRFLSGDENDADFDEGGTTAQVINSDSIVFADYNGLYRQFAGTKPVQVGTEASYSDPLVTRDGKWVIAAKDDGEAPVYLVRLSLQSGREFRINLSEADRLNAIAALPSSGKVILRRAKMDYTPVGYTPKGPNRPEFYLLDSATGVTRLVAGEFTPLEQLGSDRFLQPAEKPDEFWAVKSDEKKNETQIGRYNIKDFSFKPVMVVPKLIFNSMSMWVDASHGKVYVVYKNQLLRLPLQTATR